MDRTTIRAKEAASIAAHGIVEWKLGIPKPIDSCATFELNPRNDGVMDYTWGLSPGDYVFTSSSRYGTHTSLNGAILDRESTEKRDTNAFHRAWACARALENVAKEIPNFAYLGSNATMHRNHGVLHAKLKCIPLGNDRLSAYLAHPDIPIWEIVSYYLQVVHAVNFAYDNILFAHNILVPANIVLAPFAKLFSINYANHSVLCFNNVCVITNYHHAQFTQVRASNGTAYLVHALPDADGPGPNMKPHPSGDLYKFTAECVAIIESTLKVMSRSDRRCAGLNARLEIFKGFLGYYLPPAMLNSTHGPRPTHIKPYMNGMDFLMHCNKILKANGFGLVSMTLDTYKNLHIIQAYKPNAPVRSTWHALDLRALVTNEAPPSNINVCIDIADATQHDKPFSENDRLMLNCTQIAHDANERLIKAPSAITDPTDLHIVTNEIPFLLTLPYGTYGQILRTPVGVQYYNERMERIFGHVIANGVTIRTILGMTEKTADPTTCSITRPRFGR